jgi:hypothetical protein
MSEDQTPFPVGTIVTLTPETRQADPVSYRPSDAVILQSSTGGISPCRVTAISPETIEVVCGTMRYRLTPAAATLEGGGISTYAGGWVVRSAGDT